MFGPTEIVSALADSPSHAGDEVREEVKASELAQALAARRHLWRTWRLEPSTEYLIPVEATSIHFDPRANQVLNSMRHWIGEDGVLSDEWLLLALSIQRSEELVELMSGGAMERLVASLRSWLNVPGEQPLSLVQRRGPELDLPVTNVYDRIRLSLRRGWFR